MPPVVHITLRALHLGRRGASPIDATVPAVNAADAIDLVNAYECLAAPRAPFRAAGAWAPALWVAWRRACARVLAVVASAPRLDAPLPDPAALWLRLLEPFATQLAAFAAHHPIPFCLTDALPRIAARSDTSSLVALQGFASAGNGPLIMARTPSTRTRFAYRQSTPPYHHRPARRDVSTQASLTDCLRPAADRSGGAHG